MKVILFLRSLLTSIILRLALWLDEEIDERSKRFSNQGRPGHGGQHPPNRLPSGRS